MRRLMCWLFHRDYRYSLVGGYRWGTFGGRRIKLRPPIHCLKCEGARP